MKLILLAAALLVSACGKPCVFACADDSECPLYAYCLNRVACISKCVHCGGVCVASLHENCGTCAHACAAAEVCANGTTCQASCPSGQTNCQGTCADLAGDSFNCGACGTACARGQQCQHGACVPINTCS